MFPRADVSTTGLIIPATDVYTLLIYQLFSFDFVFVYDCLCVLGLGLVLTVCGNIGRWKHQSLQISGSLPEANLFWESIKWKKKCIF